MFFKLVSDLQGEYAGCNISMSMLPFHFKVVEIISLRGSFKGISKLLHFICKWIALLPRYMGRECLRLWFTWHGYYQASYCWSCPHSVPCWLNKCCLIRSISYWYCTHFRIWGLTPYLIRCRWTCGSYAPYWMFLLPSQFRLVWLAFSHSIDVQESRLHSSNIDRILFWMWKLNWGSFFIKCFQKNPSHIPKGNIFKVGFLSNHWCRLFGHDHVTIWKNS